MLNQPSAARNQPSPITILKLNLARQETFRYSGEVLERSAGALLLEAFFNRPDLPFHGLVMGKGDRFVEVYFSQRWYNIFEMHDRQDDHLKGWYCNVTLPAEISDQQVSYVDLALDLLIFPDGRQLVLDEDEFEKLDLDVRTRVQALAALHELQGMAAGGKINLQELAKES
jgi:uncharacterized protein